MSVWKPRAPRKRETLFAPDCLDRWVRGGRVEPPDGVAIRVALSTILAAGNDFTVFNGYCGAESGWVPVSAASPSLLVGQMEVAHKPKGHDRPPILPPPPFSPGAVAGGSK